MEATRGKGQSAEILLLTSPNSSLSEIAHILQIEEASKGYRDRFPLGHTDWSELSYFGIIKF